MLMKRAIAMMVVSCMLLAGMVILMPTASAYPEEAPRIQVLKAGQNIPVGTVKVWNDENTLHIEYTITAPWKMSESHLMVVTCANGYLSGIPMTPKGNPIPGKFTWGDSYNPGVSHAEFEIDLSDNDWDEGTWLYVAAHAVVKNPCGQSETAWASGCHFNEFRENGRGSWATYFGYLVD